MVVLFRLNEEGSSHNTVNRRGTEAGGKTACTIGWSLTRGCYFVQAHSGGGLERGKR